MAKKKLQELHLSYALLALAVAQCEGADGFDKENGTIHLTIDKGKIVKASMSYVPEPAEEAVVELCLGD